MTETISLLLIEDSALDAELVLKRLRKAGIEPSPLVQVDRSDAVKEAMACHKYDIILSDFSLPDINGVETLSLARHHCPETPFIFVSGAFGEELAIEMLQNGATDYVLKTRLDRLPTAVRRAIAEANQLRQRRRMEEDLARKVDELARANEELTRSNMELERFAYVSSHDLQEPLRKIASYAQLLGDTYRGRLDETADRYIAMMMDSVTRMHELIKDLLSYSRLRDEPATEAVDLNLVVQGILRDLEPTIREARADVSVGPLPTISGSRSQMYQLFQNLIGNAVKFRAERPPRIEIFSEPEDVGMRISVRDNGIGIEPEHHARIFDVFQRLHPRHRYPGNGIGLAICKKIAESHGGTIRLMSVPGEGSVFSVWLPARG